VLSRAPGHDHSFVGDAGRVLVAAGHLGHFANVGIGEVDGLRQGLYGLLRGVCELVVLALAPSIQLTLAWPAENMGRERCTG
jgi:hypothetical protein